MKNRRVPILSIITNIILIAILCSFIKINGSIIKEKQIIKEMNESTQVTDLNNQINALNTEHTEYMNYIQTCKAQLASAITEMGVETSEDASIDTMVSNIRSISTASSADSISIAIFSGNKSSSTYGTPFSIYYSNAIGNLISKIDESGQIVFNDSASVLLKYGLRAARGSAGDIITAYMRISLNDTIIATNSASTSNQSYSLELDVSEGDVLTIQTKSGGATSFNYAIITKNS